MQPFLLRLPMELHRQLRHHALDAGSSLQDVLVEVIEGWWSEQRAKQPAPPKASDASPQDGLDGPGVSPTPLSEPR
ncbi:MAG: hypothetical protein JWM10_3196 [Myxococcaceae bacterium]|nr:hypothetical protein [Myxococcaceae bacterium]